MTTQTRPSLAELEQQLRDPDHVQNLIAENRFGEWVKEYADAKMAANSDLETRVREETEQVLTQWLQEHGQAKRLNLTPDDPKGTTSPRNAVYNASAPGAALDKDYKGSADFFQSIWHQAASLSNSDELLARQAEWKKIQNSFGSQVPADGGFLIPEELRSELLQVSLESSVVRPRARVIPMSSLAVPIPIVDDTSHVGSVFGGITAFWTEEGAAAEESQAKFGRARLEAKKLTIYTEAPNELVADAPAFGSFLDQILPQAIAFYEDVAFIKGSGVGEPLGVINSDASIEANRGTANTIAFADIVGMYARMLPQSLMSAVWIISPAVVPQLLQLVNDTGTEAVSPSLWLTGGQLFNAPTMSLLGRPVIVSEKVPNLGTAGDITFVDFGFYLIGDRQVAQATSSPHFRFRTDETAYKIVERVDGRPWLNNPIEPENGGDTLSPIVKLGA